MMLKIYVWEGVLSDYTSGLAIAVARSKEEAVRVLSRKVRNGSYRDAAGKSHPAYSSLMESEIEELKAVEPKVYPMEPISFWVRGGG